MRRSMISKAVGYKINRGEAVEVVGVIRSKQERPMQTLWSDAEVAVRCAR